MKILIIEDNKELNNNMQQYLTREGYVCEYCYSFAEGIIKLNTFEYDCILLDIMLPDGNGLELLEFIRRKNLRQSVLITSAKNAMDDKISGLDLGADDYITKPFHLPELHARLKAVYRRKNMQGNSIVQFNEIAINSITMEVHIRQHMLDLTKKEFDLILFFIINKNRVLSRQAIAEHLWGDYTDNLSNFDFVYQHVKNLRKKICEAGGTDYIVTIYGLGYKFNINKK